MPTISKSDWSFKVVATLLNTTKLVVPSAANKIRHTMVLQRLTMIVNDGPHPRVDTSAQPRVAQQASLSNNITSPRVIKYTRCVHQCVKHNNTPIPFIMVVDKPPRDADIAVITRNQSGEEHQERIPPAILHISQRKCKPNSHKINGILIGSKQNNVKNASQKRIRWLIDKKPYGDQLINLCEPIERITYNTPQKKSYISFHAPDLKTRSLQQCP